MTKLTRKSYVLKIMSIVVNGLFATEDNKWQALKVMIHKTIMIRFQK